MATPPAFKKVFSSTKRSTKVTTTSEPGAVRRSEPDQVTLRNLTVFMTLASFVSLNPLACVCVIPALLYTFRTPRPAPSDSSSEKESTDIDNAGKAIFWNFLAFLSYPIYFLAVLLAVFFTVGPLSH